MEAQPADRLKESVAYRWRQIKGDPSIRGTVFHQNRSESEMDRQLDTVLGAGVCAATTIQPID